MKRPCGRCRRLEKGLREAQRGSARYLNETWRPQNAREVKVDSKRRMRHRSKEETNERPSEQRINAKSIENQPQIDEKSTTNRSGAPWKRFGAIGGAPGTRRGCFRSAPGRSRDVLGRPQAPPRTLLRGCWLARGTKMARVRPR